MPSTPMAPVDESDAAVADDDVIRIVILRGKVSIGDFC